MEITCLPLSEQNEILLGSFHLSVCMPGTNLEVQGSFLHCNFLITFSKTQRLNLAWALENIQTRAHYIKTASFPSKPTWKKEEKAEVSVLQTAQHFGALVEWLHSKTSVASSLPIWNTLSLHIQKGFGEISWRTSATEILAHLYIFLKIIQATSYAGICNSQVKHVSETVVFTGSEVYEVKYDSSSKEFLLFSHISWHHWFFRTSQMNPE